MAAIGITLLTLSLVSVGAFVVAVRGCVQRRWRSAVVVARSVAISGPIALLLALAGVVARAGTSDVAAKATALASGIAEVMNGGIVLFLAAILSAIVWAVAAWRLRVARSWASASASMPSATHRP
jgi:hypothetical protein